jgi:hypothetical protein
MREHMHQKVSAAFGALGAGCASRPSVTLSAGSVLAIACGLGIFNVKFEDRVNKLWVESGGRLDDELEYIELNNGTDPRAENADQFVLTVSDGGVLNQAILDEHMSLLEAIHATSGAYMIGHLLIIC